MTYTEGEIALARRGVKWCWDKYKDDTILTNHSDALFVALLCQCDAEGICVKMETASECIEVELIIEAWRVGPAFHKNRALALLLALDAAGLLPESTP